MSNISFNKSREWLIQEISKRQLMPVEVTKKLVDVKGKLKKTSFARRLHEKTGWL